jgi:hypothetical protein
LKIFGGGAILSFRVINACAATDQDILPVRSAKETTMSLMKFFFSRPVLQYAIDIDPLQHPALAAMSLLELADLPLIPENLGRVEVAPHPACRPPSPRLRGEGDRGTCRRS